MSENEGCVVNTDPPLGCTCHPDDNPPVPCPRRHALSECWIEAWRRGTHKFVPVDPTDAMLLAGQQFMTITPGTATKKAAGNVYEAMIGTLP